MAGAHYMNKLLQFINVINQETRDQGEGGFLNNDPDHWAECGVYTPADLELYLEKEHERNMYKNQLGE